MKKGFTAVGISIVLSIPIGCTTTGYNSPKTQTSVESKSASELTKKLNEGFYAEHNLVEDGVDFQNAQRHLVEKVESLQIPAEGDSGVLAWDMDKYTEMLNANTVSPETVNPSLWRNFRLNMEYGLYEVVPGNIYQVRGYDLSNVTFVRTPGTDEASPDDDGWLVIDPLISKETAEAALDLLNKNVGELPVKGVIYSHSHIDHFAGVRGLFADGTATDDVVIFAPEGFTEHAVSENVIAGNAMGRRAIYMYGALTGVDIDGKKSVGAGLGITNSIGTSTMIVPTNSIIETTPVNNFIEISNGTIVSSPNGKWEGLQMQFQMTPGSEAPAEMNTYFKNWNALWMAENSTNTMHNILTLRGAPVRDPLIWAKYLTETMERWGNVADVKFQSHHWPIWKYWNNPTNKLGSEDKILDYLEKQRDIYKFIHDQTVRHMNKGLLPAEISEILELPDTLDSNWSTRGYYGTLSHNSRAVYQRYMGWYTGNPSDLNTLPQEKVAKKYVEYMGGARYIIDKVTVEISQADLDLEGLKYYQLEERQEVYRWAAEVLKHVVFADVREPEYEEAKLLLADVYEQLGYQAESGPWRSVYHQGALELREGKSGAALETASEDIIKNMTLPQVFDYWAVRIDLAKLVHFGDIFININVHMGESNHQEGVEDDEDESYTLTLKNGVLNYYSEQKNPPGSGYEFVEITLELEELYELVLEDKDFIDIDSDPTWVAFGDMLETPKFWFDIVTPRELITLK